MTENNQEQLGKTLDNNIANQLRWAMNAEDFRDNMLAYLLLRLISDISETATLPSARGILTP